MKKIKENSFKIYLIAIICFCLILVFIVLYRNVMFNYECRQLLVKEPDVLNKIEYRQAIFIFGEDVKTSTSRQEIRKILDYIYNLEVTFYKEKDIDIEEKQEKQDVSFDLYTDKNITNKYGIKSVTMNVYDSNTIKLQCLFKKYNISTDVIYLLKMKNKLDLNHIRSILE